MSYDISLYPRQPGQDWDAVMKADQQDGPEMDQAQLDSGVATFRRIEARLREQLTEPVQVWVAEETDGDVVGELSATDSGLQVELYDRSASVSFSYRDRGDLASFHDLVRRAVAIAADETGYQAYDHQTGSTFDGTFDDATGREAVRALGAADGAGDTSGGLGAAGVGGASLAGATGDDPDADSPEQGRPADRVDPRRSPQALRRRAWLYVIIGIVLLFFGGQRWMAGDTSWLTWLILGIGAFDLIGGWMMFATSRQLAAREAAAPSGTSTDDGGTSTDDGGTSTDDGGTSGITHR